MIAQQHGPGGDALLLGDLDDGRGREQRATGAAKGAVGHDVDALLPAKVDNLLLRQRRVVLDLVDGGHDGAVREQLLQVALAVL